MELGHVASGIVGVLLGIAAVVIFLTRDEKRVKKEGKTWEEKVKAIEAFATQHATLLIGDTRMRCVPSVWTNKYDAACPALKCVYVDARGNVREKYFFEHELEWLVR